MTAALKRMGMYDNTLFVFTSDNGGPTTTSDGVGARNWPLRGGKHSIWEGGTRAIAVVSTAPHSKVLNPEMKGKHYYGLMHGVVSGIRGMLPNLSISNILLPTTLGLASNTERGGWV